MQNPYNIFCKDDHVEGKERPTITRTADRIGVSHNTLYNWLTGKKQPRPYNLAILANHLNCTHQETRDIIKRCSDIVKAGYKLPFGVMVTWDMLKNSHARLLAGQHPFPPDTSNLYKDRIEYD